MENGNLFRRIFSSVRSTALFVVFVVAIVSVPLVVTISDGRIVFRFAEASRQLGGFLSSIRDGTLFDYTAGTTQRAMGKVLPRYFLNSLIFIVPPAVLSIVISVVGGRRHLASRQSSWRYLPLALGILPSFVVAVILQFLAVQVYQHTGVRVARVARLSIEQPALLLPMVTLTLVTTLFLSRFVSSTVARLRTSDFVAFARSRGISEGAVYYRHVLPGVVADLRHGLHGFLGILFADLFILERVFRIPGLTQAIIANAISYQWSYIEGQFIWTYQYNLILSSILLIGFLYTVVYGTLRLTLHGVLVASRRRNLD